MKRKIPTAEEVHNFMMTLPGKREHDIPGHIYDRMYAAANGVTQQIWGTPPQPEQMQWLYDNGFHQPDQVVQVYGSMPHPHAPSVTVGEYEKFSKAKQLYDQLQGKINARGR